MHVPYMVYISLVYFGSMLLEPIAQLKQRGYQGTTSETSFPTIRLIYFTLFEH
jgi:hypothetical protein